MAVGTYAPALLEFAGAKKAKADLVSITPTGMLHGLRIVDLQFRVTWT
jgi:hypothetical protein